MRRQVISFIAYHEKNLFADIVEGLLREGYDIDEVEFCPTKYGGGLFIIQSSIEEEGEERIEYVAVQEEEENAAVS